MHYNENGWKRKKLLSDRIIAESAFVEFACAILRIDHLSDFIWIIRNMPHFLYYNTEYTIVIKIHAHTCIFKFLDKISYSFYIIN